MGLHLKKGIISARMYKLFTHLFLDPIMFEKKLEAVNIPDGNNKPYFFFSRFYRITDLGFGRTAVGPKICAQQGYAKEIRKELFEFIGMVLLQSLCSIHTGAYISLFLYTFIMA
ncbi:hypothetical protein ACJX0J_033176 [Zea mays]